MSPYTADITVSVSHFSNIVEVQQVLTRYEKISWAKMNVRKSESLQLGAWRGGILLPRPFFWSDGPICTLKV